MASGGRMCWIQLLLGNVVAVFIFISSTDGSELEMMSAPSLLRVGTPENIFVEVQDCVRFDDIPVEIAVMSFPTKSKPLARTTLTLSMANNYQGFGRIKIPAEDFSNDPNIKQYVYLQAHFPGRVLEKVVLVSFHSGSIFIQTDRTVYTPESNVLYRLFAVTPGMEAVANDGRRDFRVNVKIETPEGIILPVDTVSVRSGIMSGRYILPEIVSYGLWKLVANFQSNPREIFTAEFEVKENVPRSFEVKLTPSSSFFYMDSEALTVNIESSYTFGQEVAGTAYAVFGVMQDHSKRSFRSSSQRVPIVDGKGVLTLTREHITQTFPNIRELVGKFIFVSVSVLTESGGEMVETMLKGIVIATSPYTISFKRSSRYFKPGMPFDAMIEVIKPDNSPAQGVPVVVDPGNILGFTSANGVAKVTVNTAASTATMRITARTNDPLLSADRQASAVMDAHSYKTNSNNYLLINVAETELELGGLMKVNLILSRHQSQRKDITYLILSRGQLVKYGRYQIQGAVLSTLTLPITKDMLPSFRFIAYYHTNSEVISDSVWMDVKDSCIGSKLKLEPERPPPIYHPHRHFGLKITGDPQAIVGLVAVDKSTHVLNKLHLTQKKIWDTVEKSDTGCTPGGGKDGMGVFYDAGLLFETDAFGTPDRIDFKCPASSRRKRDTTDMDTGSQGEDDRSYMNSEEINVRTRFFESWLWMDFMLDACPHRNPNCASTSSVKTIPLPESVTTWLLTGISLSPTHGICVSDPLEVKVQKNFFIDLRLPYSATRGEQVEVRAILHNYSPDPLTVRVELEEETSLCSAAHNRGPHHQMVELGAQTTLAVPFIVIPLNDGILPINVKAAVKDSTHADGIRKMLRVVPAGILVKSLQTVILNPAQKGVDGKQVTTIKSEIPPLDVIPNTPVSTIISLTGGEMSPLVENIMSGDSMNNLIVKPSGSGEVNMIGMTNPVTAVMFLDQTNQWETVGFKKRATALQYISEGYSNELAFRQADGSFSTFAGLTGSTWLTAYVAKVFSMVHNLMPVDSNVICSAIKFLILAGQGPNGEFTEKRRVWDVSMTGDVTGTDSDASMTAFCLIAMQESRSICDATVSSLPNSIHRAVTFLEQRLPSLTSPYAVAMTSYALANQDKLNKEILLKFAALDRSHWPVRKGHVLTMEATAYALRALVKAEALEEANPVAKWLSSQQRVNGGFGSTQATITVYQALAEYWSRAKSTSYSLNVEILLPGKTRPDSYTFNRENHRTTRTSKFKGINKDVIVTATGTGEATLKMVSLYYSSLPKMKSNCEKFNLSVQVLPEKHDGSKKTFKLTINLLYKDRQRDATLSILEVGLPTGFTFNKGDLESLSTGRARLISLFEADTVLSEKGSIKIYLDKISHTQPEEISFRIHQEMKVGLLKPATVWVYEYYNWRSCSQLYQPEESEALVTLCHNGQCVCGEDTCSKQRKEVRQEVRIAKSCEISPNKVDFVYKISVEALSDGPSADIYTMRITEVIKEGSMDVITEGEVRTFLGDKRCRDHLDLKTGKTYLIMGQSRDIHKAQESTIYHYVLSGKTWIEYWPTAAECQMAEYRVTCLGMSELSEHHMVFGCQN